MSALMVAGMAPNGAYAQRAARDYLAAYERQNGTRYTIGCPMLAAQARLSNVMHSHGALEVEIVAGEWHGLFWRRYAYAILVVGLDMGDLA